MGVRLIQFKRLLPRGRILSGEVVALGIARRDAAIAQHQHGGRRIMHAVAARGDGLHILEKVLRPVLRRDALVIDEVLRERLSDGLQDLRQGLPLHLAPQQRLRGSGRLRRKLKELCLGKCPVAPVQREPLRRAVRIVRQRLLRGIPVAQAADGAGTGIRFPRRFRRAVADAVRLQQGVVRKARRQIGLRAAGRQVCDRDGLHLRLPGEHRRSPDGALGIIALFMQPIEAPGLVRQRLRIERLPAPARIDLADKAAQVKPLRLLHRHVQRGRPVLFPRGKIVQIALRHGVGRRVIAQCMQPAGQRCRCPALGQGEKSERRAEQQAARKQQGRRPSPVRAEQQQGRHAARQKQQAPARREQPNGAADRRKRQRNGRKPYAPAPGAAAGGQRRKKAERQEGPEALPHSARRC